jgi:hypothetical protein
MNPEEDLELIAEIHAGADVGQLEKQLTHPGVQTLPMKVGVLLSGAPSALRGIVPTLGHEQQGAVAVPDHLKDVIKAIHVVGPKSFMQ